MSPHDAPAYRDYLAGLTTLRDLPAAQEAGTRAATQAYERAVSWADTALAEATAVVDAGEAAVVRHLSNAAGFVAGAGLTQRVPQRIKPSIVPATATRADVEAALRDLTDATLVLGRTVAAITTAPVPGPPGPAPAGAAAAAAAPPRTSARLSRVALTGIGLLVTSVTALAIVLLTR